MQSYCCCCIRLHKSIYLNERRTRKAGLLNEAANSFAAISIEREREKEKEKENEVEKSCI